MSLSWGTGSLAADLAVPHQDRRAAVIGSGVVGLTAARELQRRGFAVTIYAAALPPDPDGHVQLVARRLHAHLGLSTARGARRNGPPSFSRRWTSPTAGSSSWLALVTASAGSRTTRPPTMSGWPRARTRCCPPTSRAPRCSSGPASIRSPRRFAIERPEMRIEPSIYLEALLHDFKAVRRRTSSSAGSSRRRRWPLFRRTSSSTAPAWAPRPSLATRT